MVRLKGIEESAAGVRVCRQVVHPMLALGAAACLLTLVGWTGKISALQHWATLGIGFAFALQRGWVFLNRSPEMKEKRRLGFHAGVGVLVLVLAAVLTVLPRSANGEWSVSGHVLIQFAVVVSGVASMIFHQTRITARAFHPGLVLLVSFLGIIAIGGGLLKMPRCVVAGQTLTWLDAFFTSTSAVCVTGLAVQNTAQFFTFTGQMVILLLIQIGGLGIMTLTFFAAVVLFEGLTLHDRILLGKMIQENRLARVGRTLSFIVTLTFVCEGLGALVLFMGLEGFPSLKMRLFHSVFHSVSAFCNAGFSTLPDGMASQVVHGNWVWQGVIMILIVIGGLGALVNEDLSMWVLSKIRRRHGERVAAHRLRVHTRLVVWVTAGLIVGGAVLILLSEYAMWHGPENGGRILTAFFHSVTARTAGFNTVSMTALGPVTVALLIGLMFIGGSPGGTAGGVRTTVIAVGLAHLWSQLRMSRRGMTVFNRTIPAETGAQALGVMVLTFLWLTVNFFILKGFQSGSGIPETSLLFELVSGFATVGLSLDLTPALTPEARMLLIVNMFVGRVGLLTVIATLVPPDARPASGKPKEEILLT